MEWIEAFYARQDQLSRVYSGPMMDQDRERARIISAVLDGQSGRVLELGAGGGQSAQATAQCGHHVTAIELVPGSAAHARSLASRADPGSLRVLEGSFYTLALAETFDLVCYWDGFGVGSDEDQRVLLRRIADWLVPTGTALIDINTPWYWAKAAGRQMSRATFVRQYDFDADACRMLDHWWSPEEPGERVTQSLRCYSPQDLRLLLEGTGLILEHIEAGGALDYDTGTWTARAPLSQAMQFRAHLRHLT